MGVARAVAKTAAGTASCLLTVPAMDAGAPYGQ